MFKGHAAEGMVIGTGAVITIQTGWIPSYIRIINETGLCIGTWHSNMAAGSMIKNVTAGTVSKPTTGGISPYAGTSGGNGAGFTIGTDTNLNATGDRIHYFAVSTDA